MNSFFDLDFDYSKISKLETRAQYKKIDVMVIITYLEKEYILIIEDKTYSEIGKNKDTGLNQLDVDKQKIDKEYPNSIKKYVYYKTNLISKTEEQEV